MEWFWQSNFGKTTILLFKSAIIWKGEKKDFCFAALQGKI